MKPIYAMIAAWALVSVMIVLFVPSNNIEKDSKKQINANNTLIEYTLLSDSLINSKIEKIEYEIIKLKLQHELDSTRNIR